MGKRQKNLSLRQDIKNMVETDNLACHSWDAGKGNTGTMVEKEDTLGQCDAGIFYS